MMVSLLAVALLSQASGPVLTLEEALQTAESHNLDLQAARSRLAQAQELSKKAWSGYLPQLSVSGQYTYNSASAELPMVTGYVIREFEKATSGPAYDRTKPPGFDNQPGEPTKLAMLPAGVQTLEIQKEHQLGATVQLQQALIAPSLWPAISNAALAVEVTELNLENARREILFATAQLYYGAVSLREAVEVQTRLLEVSSAHVKDAQARVEHGTAPKIVLLRARIEEAKAKQDVRRSELGYASAKSALATLLNRPPDFEVSRPKTPVAPEVDGALDEAALRSRLDVQAARTNVTLAEGTRRGVYYRYAPTLAFIGRFNVGNTAGFTGDYSTWTAGLGLNWTLWDGGLRESELREASAKLEESRLMLTAAENKARDEVRRALLDLETARSNRLTAEEQLTLARENAALVKASFEAGAGTYLEVVDANAALTGAELSNLSETLNVDLAVLKLARAAGLFEPL